MKNQNHNDVKIRKTARNHVFYYQIEKLTQRMTETVKTKSQHPPPFIKVAIPKHISHKP